MDGNIRTAFLAGLLAVSTSFAIADDPTRIRGPVSPQDSLKHMVVHPDLKVELVACEPQVTDPVAMAFDELGRLWIVEMTDYPNGPSAGEPPKSRIRLLRDDDGDGFYESAETFADGLLFANGIQPWKGGVIVTMAGEVAYLKDTDGDNRADVKETWLTGFKAENPQLRANHPTFGLDNHIYVANGLRGGVVAAAKEDWTAKSQPVSISGRDFRFNPLTGESEAISGVGQFGLTFDAFGNRFVCSNRNPCKHIVLKSQDLARNPNFAARQIYEDVSPAGEDSRVYPLVNAWTTSTLHSGQFTAACGVTIYQGNALPALFRGNSFTCEPTGSLIHRDVLSPNGATFTSRAGREALEFLSSRDPWFRAVNLANAPDGALYFTDIYRAVIEHPQFMPVELKNRPDLTLGNDKGRIYRLVPKDDWKPERNPSNIAKLSSQALVALLDHPNGWHRETVSRLIYEHQSKEMAPHLIHLVEDGKTPEGRVRALWALKGLDQLTADVVLQGLNDSHPRVIEHAVRLCEPWLKANRQDVKSRLKTLANHTDDRVRFQLALTLGNSNDDEFRYALLATIATKSPRDPWLQSAILSSTAPRTDRFLIALLQHSELKNQKASDLWEATANVVGAENRSKEIREILTQIATNTSIEQDTIGAILQGLGEGLSRRRVSLASVIAELDAKSQDTYKKLFEEAANRAKDVELSRSEREQSLGLLKFADAKLAESVLIELATRERHRELKIQAIDRLSRLPNADVTSILLKNFRAKSPPVRRAILDCLLAQSSRTEELLTAIEAKTLSVSELSPTQVRRLTTHRDMTIRKKAKELLAEAIPQDRKKVIADYQACLSLKADPKRGRAIFVKNCAACHRIGDEGSNVAPDIADSRTRTPSFLLTNILAPNQAVDNNYFSYTVLTSEGRTLTGILETETENSITLKQPEGKTTTILRSEIEDLKSDGVSLMPVGLEKNISPQQMADLISYIKNWRYLDDPNLPKAELSNADN